MIADHVVVKLRGAIDGQVTDDPSSLDRHAADAWPVSVVSAQLGQLTHRPDLVVSPAHEQDVSTVLAIADANNVPVTAWGLGSSVTGQPLPLAGGISLDLAALRSPAELNEVDRVVTAAAGTQGGELETWLNERGYTLNHFPQSLLRSSVGGWLATRATGQFSSRYGGIEDLVVGYRVVLADGAVCELGQRPRAAMGPDLRQIFLGSEGTLGVITQVSLKVFALPPHRVVEAFALNSVHDGLMALRTLYQAGLRPFLARLYDADEARHVLDEAVESVPALLLIGSEGVEPVADAEFGQIRATLFQTGARSLGRAPVDGWLERRYDFSGVESLLAEPGGYAETIEVANMWSRLEPMYDELKNAFGDLADEILGHFSHVYDQGASLYIILRGRAADNQVALDRLKKIWAVAMDIVVRHDGELSHHHGGGLARRPWVRRSLGSGFVILERLKSALDPNAILNPGKLALASPHVDAENDADGGPS